MLQPSSRGSSDPGPGQDLGASGKAQSRCSSDHRPHEVLAASPALQMDITSLYNLKFQPPALVPELACPEGSPLHSAAPQKKDSMGELSRATIRLLEELDRER